MKINPLFFAIFYCVACNHYNQMLPLARFYTQNKDFNYLFLIEDADTQWSLLLGRDSLATGGFFTLDGERFFRHKDGLFGEQMRGRWDTATAIITLELLDKQEKKVGALRLSPNAVDGWRGRGQLYGDSLQPKLTWLGCRNPDSLRLFSQAVAEIYAYFGCNRQPISNDGRALQPTQDSAVISFSPDYYQCTKPDDDIEFYQISHQPIPTVWVLERASKYTRLSVFQQKNGAWKPTTDVGFNAPCATIENNSWRFDAAVSVALLPQSVVVCNADKHWEYWEWRGGRFYLL